MKGVRFKVWKAESDYRFHVVAGNGEIIAPSEGYTRLADAQRAVRGLWKGFAIALGFMTFLDSTGRFLPPVPYTDDSLKPKRLLS